MVIEASFMAHRLPVAGGGCLAGFAVDSQPGWQPDLGTGIGSAPGSGSKCGLADLTSEREHGYQLTDP